MFQIATLSLDVNGKWSIHYSGEIAEQGGLHFGHGNATFSSYEEAIDFLETVVAYNFPEYRRRIKDAYEEHKNIESTR